MTTTPRWEIKVVSSITDFDQYKIGEVGKDHFCVVDRLSDAEEIVERVNAIIEDRNVLLREVMAWRKAEKTKVAAETNMNDIGGRHAIALSNLLMAGMATDALIRSKP